MKLAGKILAYPLFAVNMLISVLQIISAYCSLLPPVGSWPLLSLSGLAFPILFLANLAFLIFWLMSWKKAALLPAATILITLVPSIHYFPIHPHLSGEKNQASLTIASYNTEGFGLGKSKERNGNNPVLQHICSKGASIICLQEASYEIITAIADDSEIGKAYPYRFYDRPSGQACLSAYPIIDSYIINYPSTSKGNKCQYLKIVADNDTISVYNCHMQSNALLQKDFEGSLEDDGFDNSMKVLKKLLKATTLRAAQADTIAYMAAKDKAGTVIVCGDFNDTPLSYAHRRFDRFMTDCFAKAGNGPGFTYHEHRLFYRIDHIFCTANLVPIRCRVDRSCKLSDHYPIIAVLKQSGE